MVTFLSGGTGTPKLLDGAESHYSPDEITVIANTGDDIVLGDLFISPDVDTVLYWAADMLDRDTWWGIADDSATTHAQLTELQDATDVSTDPQYLSDQQQTAGHDLTHWRRFAALPEFMHISDRDRAIHLYRSQQLKSGASLTETTHQIADALDIDITVLPMANDPVASLIHTPSGVMHFQEFWVARDGTPNVSDVEFRGGESATLSSEVNDALTDTIIIGPSNPVTSIGPMLAIDGFQEALRSTTVIAVSPFIGSDVFSGPAAKLMDAVGLSPSSEGLPDAYPFADGFVLDESDPRNIEPPTIRTDITIDSPTDASRILTAIESLLNRLK
ncbi:2-phospho-L-lactate transferase [Salinarchaeum sp. IM2453]|uniref:2-phospho-L-lactate transferase n=1 Tax=Salinarchaeum sp. IM2453 TaxID=2862870 RepID=UPI001C83ADD3|nr:2-phospho-L-lactate transferase [Salinarchaeum sp. IM2453]QZA89242.1 2-phospho-L-lactate transferase [Salinarchaeum sp. IM2453]